jgi:hypothetical protein
MNMLKTSVVAAVGVIVLALAFAISDGGRVAAQGIKPLLVQVINTVAEPVPVKPVVSAADHVQLQFQGAVSEACPAGTLPVARILPDGTSVPAFAVPPGKVLVVTDLEGTIREDVPWSAGSVGALHVGIQPGIQASARSLLAAFAPLNADAVSSAIVSMNVHSQSGVLIGPNHSVCVFATVIFSNGGGVADVNRVNLQGYLIPE